MRHTKSLLLLHLLVMGYSFGGVLSKMAAAQPFLSLRFCICYGGIITILGIYALAWQQIIKKLPLTTAYANKAVAVVWGLVWGLLIFHEAITPGKLAGATLVVVGVVLFSKTDEGVKER